MNVNDVSQAAAGGLENFFEFLPLLVGALVIVLVGWLIASVLKTIITNALQRIGFDRMLLASSGGSFIERVMERPSLFLGKVAYWLVLLGFISLALSSLNIEGLNEFMGAIYAYMPHVLASILIFLVAGTVSVAAVGFVSRVMGSTALARTISAVIPSIVMSIAVFMILNELMIATEIVTITYTALVGALALGMALAFGLGGREVASQILQQAYEKGKQNAGQATAEIERAADRTEREVTKVRRSTR